MTKEIFTAIVASGVVGAVVGILIQYHNDSRHIKEIIDTYEDYIAKYHAICERNERDWQRLVHRISNDYQRRLAALYKKSVPIIYDTDEIIDNYDIDFPNDRRDV